MNGDEQEFLIRLRAKMRDDVGRDGFSRVCVGPFPNPRGKGRPHNYAYTVGLSHTDPACADTIILGPYSPPVLMGIVWDIARSMLLEGTRYEAGSQRLVSVEGKTYPYPFFFAEVEQRYMHEFPKAAADYYGSTSFPLLQAVWPDTHGRWPWDGKYEADFLGAQPLLFDPERYPLARTGRQKRAE